METKHKKVFLKSRKYQKNGGRWEKQRDMYRMYVHEREREREKERERERKRERKREIERERVRERERETV